MGLKYSQSDCVLLAQWISDQWKAFWVYFDRALTGKVTTKMIPLTHTSAGCYSLYPDEGRRLACLAHEAAHHWYDYLSLTPAILSGDLPRQVKEIAQFELRATKIGIDKAEELYAKNCNGECENSK